MRHLLVSIFFLHCQKNISTSPCGSEFNYLEDYITPKTLVIYLTKWENQLMSSSQYKKQKSKAQNRGTVNVLVQPFIAKLISK